MTERRTRAGVETGAVYATLADLFAHDELGRVALTRTGLAERDVMVLGCEAVSG